MKEYKPEYVQYQPLNIIELYTGYLWHTEHGLATYMTSVSSGTAVITLGRPDGIEQWSWNDGHTIDDFREAKRSLTDEQYHRLYYG